MFILPTILISRRYDRVEPDVFRFSLFIPSDNNLAQLSDIIQSTFATLYPYYKPISVQRFQSPNRYRVHHESLVKDVFNTARTPLIVYLGNPLEHLGQ